MAPGFLDCDHIVPFFVECLDGGKYGTYPVTPADTYDGAEFIDFSGSSQGTYYCGDGIPGFQKREFLGRGSNYHEDDG